MEPPDHKSALTLRWFAIIWGLFSIIWLPIEDTNSIFLILLSIGWGFLALAALSQRFKSPARAFKLILIGAASGLVIPAAALSFVLIKAGLHRHGFLDFSTTQLFHILGAAPVWLLLGLLGGVLLYIFQRN